MAFVKLDAAILRSTIWYKRPDLELFLAALLMAEPREYLAPVNTIKVDSLDDGGFQVPPGWYGFVPASGPGIIAQAFVDEKTGIEALKSLGAPEKESRSQAFEGRRMVRIDGGYLILNYMRFRDIDHTCAERQRRLRERRRVTRDGNGVTRDVTPTSRIADADADADAPKTSIPSAVLTNEERIYAEYPRKVGKVAALKAIRLALIRKSVDELLEATKAYAGATKAWPAADLQYVPHPATWFNRGSFEDDRANWNRIERDTTVSWQRKATTAEDHAKGF
jgi:hypothetical protein